MYTSKYLINKYYNAYKQIIKGIIIWLYLTYILNNKSCHTISHLNPFLVLNLNLNWVVGSWICSDFSCCIGLKMRQFSSIGQLIHPIRIRYDVWAWTGLSSPAYRYWSQGNALAGNNPLFGSLINICKTIEIFFCDLPLLGRRPVNNQHQIGRTARGGKLRRNPNPEAWKL